GGRDELLDAGVEALVRVVHQQIAAANHAEDVVGAVGQRRRGARCPRGEQQLRQLQLGDRPKVLEADADRHVVELRRLKLQLLHQELAQLGVEVRVVLQSKD